MVFRPTASDKGKLSVYDGELIEPEASHVHYTGTVGKESAGVVSVTVGECRQRTLEPEPDPLDDSPAHALIDFNPVGSKNQMEKAAGKLKKIARHAFGDVGTVLDPLPRTGDG